MKSTRVINFRLVLLLAVVGLLAGCARKDHAPEATTGAATSSSPDEARKRALQARTAIERAARESSNDPAPALELALFDRMNGDVEGSERQLADIAAAHPKFARAPYHLGMMALQSGRASEAAGWMLKAAKASPDDPQVLTNASVALFRIGKITEAKELAAAALKRDALFPDAHLIMARILDEERKPDSALAHLQRYTTLAPDPAPGHFLRGRIYARQGDGKNAELWLIKAREADPANPEIHATLGRVYFELLGAMRTDDAIRSFKDALANRPDHPTARYFLGRAYMRAGRDAEAVPELQAALKTSTEPGPVHYDLAQALSRLGRKDEANKHLERHRAFQKYISTFNRMSRDIDRDPLNPAPRLALADFCLKERQPQAAEMVLQESIRRIPSSAPVFFEKMALAYEQMGREDLATRARDEAYRRKGRGR